MTDYARPHVNAQKFLKDGVDFTDDVTKLMAVEATAAEIAKAADISSNTAAYTATAAIPATVQHIELNHATVAAEMTIADLAAHQGLMTIKNTSASGTAAHKITAASGTWDGTNDVITLNAPGEFIAVWIDSAGNGTVLENVGSVALS